MYGPLILLYVIPRWNNTYTYLSLANGLYAYMFCFDQMVHMLLINHLAILMSFYITYLCDKNIFRKFSKNFSIIYFWIGNLLNHVAPVMYYGWYISTHNIRPMSPYIGIVTLMYHLLWRYRVSDSFLLDHIYVKTHPATWYLAWMAAATVHLTFPWLYFT
jgi:hypothetical protein